MNSSDLSKLDKLLDELKSYKARLVAVSKKKPAADIRQLFEHGQVDFGENYAGELVQKAEDLPSDIRWHFIGHLQSNKVRQVLPLTSLIQSADSDKLILEISKQAEKAGRMAEILLQVHIADEETKFGFGEEECREYFNQFIESPLPGIKIRGLMGMASFTNNMEQVRSEFRTLRKLFDELKSAAGSGTKAEFDTLSMGMTSDYKIALEEGSTMVRIGSMIFGER